MVLKMGRETEAGSERGCMEDFTAGVVERWGGWRICCSRTMSASSSEHVLPSGTDKSHARCSKTQTDKMPVPKSIQHGHLFRLIILLLLSHDVDARCC